MTDGLLKGHEGRIVALEVKGDGFESDIAEIKADVKAIRSKVDKGSGVVALAVILVPAAVAGLVGWLLGR